VLTGVLHTARQAAIYRPGEGTGFSYHNTFTALPAGLPFRPPRVTPKPVVHGTQTAVVVGPPGEEIFTDKYGRVKVQLPWDRQGKKDAGSSCWVRVATLWAGKQWGVIHIPRIGQEVIVAFEEGDMDKPIIVGSVYNAEQMPPYKLPDHKTQSGLKTRSTLKGGTANFNELRFEDKKGSEEVYFHAEKDFNRVVENNDTLKVGSSQADDGSQTIEVWKDRTETVKTGNEKVTIEKGDRTVTVKQGNDRHEVSQGKRDVIVQSDDTHQIKQGNRSVKIDMGNDSLQISMGDRTTKIDLGKSATEAMQSIELKVGQSSIKIDQTGVTIKGMLISVEGQIQTQIKGLMTQVNGDAMLQVKGGITMIN
jgi:type VI secretion system secreted protein VgrG